MVKAKEWGWEAEAKALKSDDFAASRSIEDDKSIPAL